MLKLPYYFKFKTLFFFPPYFPKLKIRVFLKFKVLCFTLQKSQKHHIPQRISGLIKRMVNFMNSEMNLLAKIFFLKTPFSKWGAS